MDRPCYERQFVDVDGRRVAYVQTGDPGGEPAVLVASMLVVVGSYNRTTDELAKRGFRVTTVELPGSGWSSHVDRPWSFERYADFVPALLDALRVDVPTLIGHSNSAAVALLTAARHPRRVSRLVLGDSVGADPRATVPRLVLGRLLDGLIEAKLSFQGWHHVAGNALRHPRNLLNQIRLSARTDLRPDASRVDVPVLLAWGRRDWTTLPRSLHELQRVLPNASTYVSPTGSHDWMVDHPEEFAAAVADFVHGAASTTPATGALGVTAPASVPRAASSR